MIEAYRHNHSASQCSHVGTTWLQEIVWQIYHNGEISQEGVESRYPQLEKSQLFQRPGDEALVALNSRPSPRLIKSHLPYHVIPISENEANRSKYLYIARNPKDATVSYYNFVCSFGPASYFSGTWEFFANLLVEGKGNYRMKKMGLFNKYGSSFRLRPDDGRNDRLLSMQSPVVSLQKSQIERSRSIR